MIRLFALAKIRHYVLRLHKCLKTTELYYVLNTRPENKTSWVLLAEFMLTALTLFVILFKYIHIKSIELNGQLFQKPVLSLLPFSQFTYLDDIMRIKTNR